MYSIDIINSVRSKATAIVSETSIDDLNQIPEGFNNNMAWNFGHLVVSGYSLVFRVTRVDPDFEIPYFDKYKKGSRPEAPVSKEEITALISLSGVFAQSVKDALNANRFTEIAPYTTGTFGLPITNIENMLATVALHDTVHWQTIRDYKRLLRIKPS
ncbi:MAG: DinB family protein [Niabella sp.]